MTNDRRKTDNWEVMTEKLDRFEKALERIQTELKNLSDFLHNQSGDMRVANQEIDNLKKRVTDIEKETKHRFAELQSQLKDNSKSIDKSKGFWAGIGTIGGALLGITATVITYILK